MEDITLSQALELLVSGGAPIGTVLAVGWAIAREVRHLCAGIQRESAAWRDTLNQGVAVRIVEDDRRAEGDR